MKKVLLISMLVVLLTSCNIVVVFTPQQIFALIVMGIVIVGFACYWVYKKITNWFKK